MEDNCKPILIIIDYFNLTTSLRFEENIHKFFGLDENYPMKFVFLGKNQPKSTERRWLSIVQWAIGICRSYKLLPAQRCLILPSSIQQQVIQLCLARQSKQQCGEFIASASDILDVRRILKSKWNEKLIEAQCINQRDSIEASKSYREFMSRCSCLDHFDLKRIIDEQFNKNCLDAAAFNNTIFVVCNLENFGEIERDLLNLLLPKVKVWKVTPLLPCKEDLDISGVALNVSFQDTDTLSSSSECTTRSNQDSAIQSGRQQDSPKCDCPESTSQSGHQEGITQSDLPKGTTALYDRKESTTLTDHQKEATESDHQEAQIHLTAMTESIEELLLPKEENPCDSSTSPMRLKGSAMYVEQLFLAHMRLLVNSRDELALSTTLGMPGREISEKEFNKIKSVAQSKKMPIYQTIMSTILRLQLGSKGYKPDPECPIVQNAKALTEVVNLLNLLQEVIEEEMDGRKGFGLIMNRLKGNFIKTMGSSMSRKSIDKVHQKLLGEIDIIDGYFAERPDEITDDKPQVASQTFTINTDMQPALKLLVGTCDVAAGRCLEFSIADVIEESYLTQVTPGSQGKKSTPFKIPSVLSMFRSPSSPGSPKEETLRKRMMKKIGKEKVSRCKTPRGKSSFSWLPDDLSPIYKGSPISPSDISPVIGPTLKVLAPKNEPRIDWTQVFTKPIPALPRTTTDAAANKPNKRSKRSLLSDIANLPSAGEPSLKKSKPVAQPPPPPKVKAKKAAPLKERTTKKAKLAATIKGQRTITAFFGK